MQNQNKTKVSTEKFTPLTELQKDKAIKYIFSVLNATYGNSFINNFKSGFNDSDGIDIGLKTAHKFWRQKLDFFFNSKDGQTSIKEVLNNLPIYPPNLIQFFESVKNTWTRLSLTREQAIRMQELHNAQQHLTPEQQQENKDKIQDILSRMKAMFSQNKENKENKEVPNEI